MLDPSSEEGAMIRRVLTVVALAAATFNPIPPAVAAFPGGNGLLVFERELPAGDHTQTDLYTIDPATAAVHRLTATPQRNEFGPQWNAAGTRLVFWQTAAPFGPGTIWRANAHAGNPVRLTQGFDARDPAWSPDGQRIVFTRETSSGSELWSLRADDGGDLRRLTMGGVDFEPAWSPDGTRIAFTRADSTGDPGDICVLDLVSGTLTRVTHTPAYDHQVGWSPDGRTLVLERDQSRSSAIVTVPAAGGTATPLTYGRFFDVGPAWSPDGRFIAFGSDRSGAVLDDLYLMNADGTNLHPLRSLPYSEGFPDWQPLP